MAISYSQKLKTIFGDLTYSEEKLAQYIDDHREEIRDITSQQLADKVGIGQSTVIRFSQKLGYGTFKKMIADITSDHPDQSIDLEIDEHEDTRATKEKLMVQYEAILDRTFSHNTDADIDEAVDYLFKARKIICCGFSERNIYFMQYFAYRLSSIGIDAYANTSMSMIYAHLYQCEENDAIVILSESGETRDLINFAKIAKQRGVKVISITRVSKNTLQMEADKNLKLADYGLRTFLRNSIIRISVLCILDMLFLNLVKRDFERYEREVTRLHYVTKLDYRV
ncbi:MAG: MurR/RpiR family transcriptional regulator [Clostridiales bacterium]|nr:MurR/RpiR family transcriptional regulator [Clostridiales bacterium]